MRGPLVDPGEATGHDIQALAGLSDDPDASWVPCVGLTEGREVEGVHGDSGGEVTAEDFVDLDD